MGFGLQTRKILYFTHGAVNYLPPLEFSGQQIICGPFYPNAQSGGKTRSIHTEPGEYDIEEVIADLSEEERPEIVIVRSDSSRQNWPRNLKRTGAQTVLVVGDTHHLQRPISGLLAYAMLEEFDHIIFDYTRQHAHFFVEAGLGNVAWLPGFNVHNYVGSTKRTLNHALTFVGQAGKYHAHRTRVIAVLQEMGLPIKTFQTLPVEAQKIHRDSLLSLNVSLNGDLNQRVLEIVSAGSLCFTDKLEPQAGLDLLFSNGEDLILFDDIRQLAERLKCFAQDPGAALAIAASGNARYNKYYSPNSMKGGFEAILNGKPCFDLFGLEKEPRIERSAVMSKERLDHRIDLYELVQGLHAANEGMDVHLTASVDPFLVSDLVDLPRCTFTMAQTINKKNREVIDQRVAVGQVDYVDEIDRVHKPMHLLISTQDDLEEGEHHRKLFKRRQLCASLLISDRVPSGVRSTVARILTGYEFKPNANRPAFWL